MILCKTKNNVKNGAVFLVNDFMLPRRFSVRQPFQQTLTKLVYCIHFRFSKEKWHIKMLSSPCIVFSTSGDTMIHVGWVGGGVWG